MDGRSRRAATTPASHSGGWRADDSELCDEELGVFTAERYFHGSLAAEEALWCDRRSSSSFSSVFKTGQHEGSAQTPMAATSSSEASWNSRFALLPNRSVVAGAPAVEAKPDSRTAREQSRKRPPSSSHLRRWLLGVGGCVCACGDGEESVSAVLCLDEEEAGSVRSGEKRSTEADDMLPRRTSIQTAVEDVTTVSIMPGKWVDDGDGDAFLAGTPVTRSPLQLAESGQRRGRADNSGELSMRILNPTTNELFDERRRESLDMFRPAGQGSTAREGAASAARGGGGSPDTPHRACGSRRDSGMDDAAPSELESTYLPSEASVVWSVVTAEGAASGNFSSAASGCYYYFNDGDDEEALWHTAAGAKSSRPRSRINGGGLLMGCISKRAIDAIGPPRTCAHRPEVEPAPVARVSGPDVTRRR